MKIDGKKVFVQLDYRSFCQLPTFSLISCQGKCLFSEVTRCSVRRKMKRENSNELKRVKLPSQEAFFVNRCYERANVGNFIFIIFLRRYYDHYRLASYHIVLFVYHIYVCEYIFIFIYLHRLYVFVVLFVQERMNSSSFDLLCSFFYLRTILVTIPDIGATRNRSTLKEERLDSTKVKQSCQATGVHHSVKFVLE